VADAREAAEQLAQALPERGDADKPWHTAETRDWLARFDPASEFKPAHTARTVDPRALAIGLDKVLPPNRNAVYDSGNFTQIVPYISVPGPDHIKNASDFASVGMGFGTALGYAVGTPDRCTVAFVGDGGFLMALSELETAAREQIPLVVVVMNDCAYGAEVHYLKMRSMPVAKAQFADVDFAPVAEAFGFAAATIRTMSDLDAIQALVAGAQGPVLIDCKINAAVAAAFLTEKTTHERRK